MSISDTGRQIECLLCLRSPGPVNWSVRYHCNYLNCLSYNNFFTCEGSRNYLGIIYHFVYQMVMNNGKIQRFLSNNRLLDFTVRGEMLLPVRRGHSLQKLGKNSDRERGGSGNKASWLIGPNPGVNEGGASVTTPKSFPNKTATSSKVNAAIWESLNPPQKKMFQGSQNAWLAWTLRVNIGNISQVMHFKNKTRLVWRWHKA